MLNNQCHKSIKIYCRLDSIHSIWRQQFDSWMWCSIPMVIHFSPKYQRNSMQERCAWLSEVCISFMQWCAQFRCSCNSLLHWSSMVFGQELYDLRNWVWHCIVRQEYKLDAQRRLFCNCDSYGELHIVPILTPNKPSQTNQLDTWWCVGWRGKNYLQTTIELRVAE